MHKVHTNILKRQVVYFFPKEKQDQIFSLVTAGSMLDIIMGFAKMFYVFDMAGCVGEE
jgi:hypothetical protein